MRKVLLVGRGEEDVEEEAKARQGRTSETGRRFRKLTPVMASVVTDRRPEESMYSGWS